MEHMWCSLILLHATVADAQSLLPLLLLLLLLLL
jgi:hypothetical protein